MVGRNGSFFDVCRQEDHLQADPADDPSTYGRRDLDSKPYINRWAMASKSRVALVSPAGGVSGIEVLTSSLPYGISLILNWA